jgi:flagellar motility protein MotE (MotC chaperone)
MVDEKDDNEVVGLDDPEESTPESPKKSGIKKFILPFVIGGVLFALAMIIPSLFKKEPHPGEEISQESKAKDSLDTKEQKVLTEEKAEHKGEAGTAVEHKAKGGDSIPELTEEELMMADLSFLDIDTAAIMRELGYLEPADTAESLATAVQDSVDTLNWIQEEMLKLAEQQAIIDSQRQILDSIQNRVDHGLTKIELAESSRLASLTKLYDSMKPDEVARLFENLDDSLIVQILPRMKPVNAAKILALMPPKRAAVISTRLISIAEEK